MSDLIKQNSLTDADVETLDSQNMENLFSVYVDEASGSYYYNLLKTINFPEDLDPTVYGDYETEPGDTWPLIAWKHYNNVKLWWIICASNQIENPVGMPEQGTKIKILAVGVIRDILGQMKEF